MVSGTTFGSPHDLTTFPAASNMMMGGALVEVSASSFVIFRRLTTTTLSCESTHTPLSWPVIQLSGSSFGHVGSTSKRGAVWAKSANGDKNAASKTMRFIWNNYTASG